ncbi:hypothetical protein B0H11DRAFT_1888236 [Mycena galericulata]|nr:hypothetical protein B0H11DRAFT_1888236 [Mycena galericulata]
MPLPTFPKLIERFFKLNLFLYRRLGRPLGLPFLIIYQIWLVQTKVDNPWSTNLMLFFPMPWYFSNPSPLSVRGFDKSPGAYYRRHRNIRLLRHQVVFQARDTQIRALYRLYDAICIGDEVEMKHEAIYIYYRHSWRLSEWPDPGDTDPDRYTMLAATVEELVRAVNWRLSRGFPRDMDKENRMTGRERRTRTPLPLESPPSWAAAVPPAQQKLVILSDYARFILDEEAETIRDPPVTAFDSRNIKTMAGALFFAWYDVSNVSSLPRDLE